MRVEEEKKILDEVANMSGYSEEHKKWLISFLPTLHFYYSHGTICNNKNIISKVDKIMFKYKDYYPISCTWRDEGPKPFDGDFMAACLNDYEDMFIVIKHPYDTCKNIGIHVFMECDEICYELNTATYDENNYISEEELLALIDKKIINWKL